MASTGIAKTQRLHCFYRASRTAPAQTYYGHRTTFAATHSHLVSSNGTSPNTRPSPRSSPKGHENLPSNLIHLLLEDLFAVGSPRFILRVRTEEVRVQRLVVDDAVWPLRECIGTGGRVDFDIWSNRFVGRHSYICVCLPWNPIENKQKVVVYCSCIFVVDRLKYCCMYILRIKKIANTHKRWRSNRNNNVMTRATRHKTTAEEAAVKVEAQLPWTTQQAIHALAGSAASNHAPIHMVICSNRRPRTLEVGGFISEKEQEARGNRAQRDQLILCPYRWQKATTSVWLAWDVGGCRTSMTLAGSSGPN